MNSFVKTKDKSQKKRRRIDASRSLRNQRRQKEEEEDKGTVVVPQEAIDWFFSVLFMHSRACDYNRLLLYSRPRMLYRIQTCE